MPWARAGAATGGPATEAATEGAAATDATTERAPTTEETTERAPTTEERVAEIRALNTAGCDQSEVLGTRLGRQGVG